MYQKYYHNSKTMGVALYPSEQLYLCKLNNKLIKGQRDAKKDTTVPKLS